ncbi:GNAT family N-acetyltransferase [Catenulispora yoronensis]
MSPPQDQDYFALRSPLHTPGLRVQQAGPDAWQIVEKWAAQAGHNPGTGDFHHVWNLDSDGCFIGMLGDQPVSAISVINYNNGYTHLGSHLTAIKDPGAGIRLDTMRVAIQHAGDHTIGVDATTQDFNFYQLAGFIPAWRTIRFTGPVPAEPPMHDHSCTNITIPDMREMAILDAECVLDTMAGRYQFALAIATAPDRHTLVATDRTARLRGYGVLRPAHHGYRIGPLYAQDPRAATALFDALCERAAAWAPRQSPSTSPKQTTTLGTWPNTAAYPTWEKPPACTGPAA